MLFFLALSSDSGAQYYDGTCDTTRTVHFGRPTSEMSEAYTRVLQGHVSSFFSFFRSIQLSIQFLICSHQQKNLDCHRHCHFP